MRGENLLVVSHPKKILSGGLTQNFLKKYSGDEIPVNQLWVFKNFIRYQVNTYLILK